MLCLVSPTDPAWVDQATSNLGALLVDHAHCEMKAASNALSLAARHPDDVEIVLALTELAKEELDHYQRVVKMIMARGLTLSTPPVDAYAGLLRRAAHEKSRHPKIEKNAVLVDRLLIGALIEARSCERFKLIVDALDALETGRDPEMHAFYTELFACEARHFRTYVELAKRAGDTSDAVEARLAELAEKEGNIVRELAVETFRAQVHG
jgi:tRNA-(ms[2]io[6]A)-hydroxylase